MAPRSGGEAETFHAGARTVRVPDGEITLSLGWSRAAVARRRRSTRARAP